MGPASAGLQALSQRWRYSALSTEVRLTVLLFALSFFISGVPRVYTQTAAHSLFIEAYGAAAIPWAYLAQALCVPVAGYLYLLAERRLSLRNLLVATLATQVVALLLFRVGLAIQAPLVVAATIVYFEIEFVLSSLLLWGLSNQLMNLRQGKRMFSFISAGEPVAVIVCGLSTPLLLRWLQVGDLFLLSALGAAVGIGLVRHILRQYQQPADAAPVKGVEVANLPTRAAWWRNRYVVMMVGMVAIGQMGYFLVDSAFYLELGRHYSNEQDMASFLGLYSALMGTISLVCSVLFAPWLLRRYGVRAGLLMLPGLLAAGSLATVLTSVLGGPAELLFLLVVGNKVIDQSFRYTLDKTTFVTLFQPLPADQRMRVQAGLESIVEPLSGGLAGLLLFAMINGMGYGASAITGVVLAVACVWVGLVAVQYRGYLATLRAALVGRRVSVTNLSWCDAASRALLRQGLVSPRPVEVLYCLGLLDSQDMAITADEAMLLLRHPAREVRLELARRAERGNLSLSPAALASITTAELDSEVRGALLQALAALDDDPVHQLTPYLDAPEPAVRLGASAGLIRHGGVEGVLEVGPRLLGDLNSPDPMRRTFSAQLMGRAGADHFYRPLLTLLRDPDIGVARAALRAAGGTSVAKLWSAMLDCLNQPALERVAVAALAAIGAPLLPKLDALFERDDTKTSLRCALLMVLERMGLAAADQRLVRLLMQPGRLSRVGNQHNRLLRALWRRRVHSLPGQRAMLRELLLAEVQPAVAALKVWQRLRDAQTESLALVGRVAEDLVTRGIENVFVLLALALADADVHAAYATYSKGGPSRRAYVVEMLDSQLDNEIKQWLLPLIEAADMPERAARLLAATQASNGQIGQTGQFLCDLAADRSTSSLLRACAVYAAADFGPMIAGPADARAEDPIEAEISDWVRSGCPGTKERETMLTIEKMLILRSAALFAAVRDEYLASAALSATEVHLAPGQTLFEQGDAGTAMFVIASGQLEVRVSGKRVNVIGEREVVGEMAVLDPEPRSATVIALAASVLLRLTSEDLDLLMAEDVEVARGIIQTLCRRLRLRDADRVTSHCSADGPTAS